MSALKRFFVEKIEAIKNCDFIMLVQIHMHFSADCRFSVDLGPNRQRNEQ